MTTPLPAPLVPIDVDLRDFGYMPLHVLRLRDSDLAALSTGDEFKAAVLLWCVAWHQVPAGSLPNDDRLLARFSEAGSGWKKVRTEALRGFVECADGRLYHAVIAEQALSAWSAKTAQRERTRAATEARELKRRLTLEGVLAQRNDVRDVERNEVRDEQRNEQRNVERDVHQGKGEGEGREIKGREGKGDQASEPIFGKSDAPDPNAEATLAGSTTLAMRRAGCTSVNPSHPELLSLLQSGVTPEQMADLTAEICQTHGPKPQAYIIAAMRRRLAEPSNPVATPRRSIHDERAATIAAATGANRRQPERDITPDPAGVG